MTHYNALDSYGFIESEDHTRETFFHYSELSVSPEQIEHGTTVQYNEKVKDNKVCGINVRPLGMESFCEHLAIIHRTFSIRRVICGRVLPDQCQYMTVANCIVPYKDESIDLNADEVIEDQVYHGTGRRAPKAISIQVR